MGEGRLLWLDARGCGTPRIPRARSPAVNGAACLRPAGRRPASVGCM